MNTILVGRKSPTLKGQRSLRACCFTLNYLQVPIIIRQRGISLNCGATTSTSPILLPAANDAGAGDQLEAVSRHSKARHSVMSGSEREFVGPHNIGRNILLEVWRSSSLLFYNKISWLLLLGPIALIGDSTNAFGEAFCFALSGIALIPCAER